MALFIYILPCSNLLIFFVDAFFFLCVKFLTWLEVKKEKKSVKHNNILNVASDSRHDISHAKFYDIKMAWVGSIFCCQDKRPIQ